MKKKTDEYSSVQKALEILTAFIPDGEQLGTLEISRKLDMHKSTVSRLVGVLSYHEFLVQDKSSRKYMLGPVIAQLCKASSQSYTKDLSAVARPHMDRLRDAIGESVGLEALVGDKIMVIADSPGMSMVRVGFALNSKVAINAAAGAKAILAHLSPESVERMITGELESHTLNSITDFETFEKELKKAKKKGVAFDRGEFDEDVHAIGAPVFGPDGSPVAGLVTCMIESKLKRLLEQDLVEQLTSAAAAISRELGADQG